MGRFFGWVGPVVYLIAAVAVVAFAGSLYFDAAFYSPDALHAFGPVAFASRALNAAGVALMFTPAGTVLAATWLLAMLWFVFQAAIIQADEDQDERWTAHILAVGFVGRLILMPLGLLVSLAAGALLVTYLAHPFLFDYSMLTMAVWLELFAAMLILPFAVYQLCAATRLANRGLMGGTALVWHALLSFLPVIGFVSMCGLFVNGRASVAAAHDERIAREAVAAALARGKGKDDPDAPGSSPDAPSPESPRAASAAGPEGKAGDAPDAGMASAQENRASGPAEEPEGTPDEGGADGRTDSADDDAELEGAPIEDAPQNASTGQGNDDAKALPAPAPAPSSDNEPPKPPALPQ